MPVLRVLSLRNLILVGGIGFLVGCTAGALKHTHFSTKQTYTELLAHLYKNYSQELGESGDWSDANYFAKKAVRAADDVQVDPEQPEDWSVRFSVLPTLKDARRELLDAVSGRMIEAAPKESAYAYFLYDCWLVQESNWMRDSYSTACQQEFFDVINQLSVMESDLTPPPAATVEDVRVEVISPPTPASQPPAENPTPATESAAMPHGPGPSSEADKPLPVSGGNAEAGYKIYFPFDVHELDAEDLVVVKDIKEAALKTEAYLVTINGHADREGPESYNLNLSRARAIAVRDELIDLGLSREQIQVFGFGESDPAFVTEDGIREALNRRAEIIIE